VRTKSTLNNRYGSAVDLDPVPEIVYLAQDLRQNSDQYLNLAAVFRAKRRSSKSGCKLAIWIIASIAPSVTAGFDILLGPFSQRFRWRRKLERLAVRNC